MNDFTKQETTARGDKGTCLLLRPPLLKALFQIRWAGRSSCLPHSLRIFLPL